MPSSHIRRLLLVAVLTAASLPSPECRSAPTSARTTGPPLSSRTSGPPPSSKPSTKITPLKQAQTLIEDGKYAEALPILNALLTREPLNVQAYTSRAHAHMRLAALDKALADANRAIEINPRYDYGYAIRAGIHGVLGEREKAFADSQKSIALPPDTAIKYSVRGWLYDADRNYTKALEDCNRAVALEPTNAKYWTQRGTILRALGKYDQALSDYTQGIKLRPKKCTAYIERAHTYILKKQPDKAFLDYDQAVKVRPDVSDPFRGRAVGYENVGEYQKEIDDLTTALKMEPKNSYSLQNRAAAQLRLGRMQAAIDDALKALEYKPKNAFACSVIASAYEDLNQPEKALEYRDKELALDKSRTYSLATRARLKEILGKYAEAEADWQAVVIQATPEEVGHLQGCYPLLDLNALKNGTAPDAVAQNFTQIKALRDLVAQAPVVLPFTVDDGNHFSVPVVVNGHPLNYMVDTGCGHSDLWKHASKGIAEAGKERLRAQLANEKEYEFGYFRAGDFSIGNLNMPNIFLGIQEGLPEHKTISGFLGGNVLETFVVTVDYDNSQVILGASADSYSDVANKTVVPMIIKQHRPSCLVKLNDKTERLALLDTGCPVSLAPDSLMRSSISHKIDFDQVTTGPWIGSLRVGAGRPQSLSLGGTSFPAPVFDIFPAREAPQAADQLIIGNDFLARFKTVTFDFPKREIILVPSEQKHENATVIYWEGRYQAKIGQYEAAVKSYTRCMELDIERNRLRGLYRRADAYVSLKQYENALSDWTALIKLLPDDAENYYLRGLTYGLMNQRSKEIADYTAALKIDPKFKPAQTALARAKAAGQKKSAR